MSPRGAHDQRASARALDKAARRTWRDWHSATLKARRDPGARRLVHRFRIATRRLLAVEALLAAAPRDSPIRGQLDPALRVAGKLRDLHICRAKVAELDGHHEAARAVARAARKRLPVLVQRLDQELRTLKPRAIRQAVRRLRARLHVTQDSAAARQRRARVLATALHRHRTAHRQLDRYARGLDPDIDDASLHSLRLQLKGVRYMSELLASPTSLSDTAALAFDTWQRALGAITDLRAVLREIDRCRVHHRGSAAALLRLHQHVLRAERRRILALFRPANADGPGAAQLRLLRTAPLVR